MITSHSIHETLPRYSAIAVFAALLLLLASSSSFAQVRNTNPPPSAQPSPEDKKDEDVDFGSRESEARMRMVLKAEQKAYDEHVARAKEASQIAKELRDAFDAKQSFGSDDNKKFERLEKLTRRIRNQAGGSDSEADPKNLPPTRAEAVKAMADTSEELRKKVEETPRRVVSAAVIDQANKLIALIDYIRRGNF